MVRHPALPGLSALSGLLPLGMLAYIAWKVLEGGKETLYRGEFSTWLTVVGMTTILAVLVGAWFWRSTSVLLAFAGGVGLVVVACLVGQLIEVMVTTS